MFITEGHHAGRGGETERRRNEHWARGSALEEEGMQLMQLRQSAGHVCGPLGPGECPQDVLGLGLPQDALVSEVLYILRMD